MSGRGDDRVEVHEAFLDLLGEVIGASPTMSAPAARASACFSPLAKTATRAVLPVP
jgi:hypothetical protein